VKQTMVGQKFGYWEVIKKDDHHPGSRNSFWICRCQCGTVRSITRSSLITGRSSSCGCKPSENRKGINMTHGMSKTRLYHEWLSMRRRCKNPKLKSSECYVGKGITVCDEWQTFEPFHAWAIENGYDDSLTIDRIDNSKGYSPSNCRWVTNEEQQQNKTNTVSIEYNGESWCLRTLCTHLGFPYKTAHRRYMRLKHAGKEISADKILEPIHTEKIAKRYRNHSDLDQ